MAVTLRGDRGAFGAALTPPQASPLRLGALPAAGTGVPRLALDANGNVTAGVLTVADMPLGSDWTWGTGTTIAFAPGPLAVPAPTSRSLGTRLILEPVPGSTEYAIGREAGALWTSVPTLVAHKWYQGASERLRLDTDGNLKLLNSVVGLTLSAGPTGEAGIASTQSLYLDTGTGALAVTTGAGLITPTLGYRENLGQLSRKFLTLHAAELWVETLVAQDTMATIGGRILVGPTTTLMADLPAAGVGPGPNYEQSIYVKHNQIQYDDWLWLEANGHFEIMHVVFDAASAVPPFAYVVHRNRDGSGLSDWYAGDAVFNTGTTGDGFIDLYSVSGVNPGTTAGPTIVGNVRTAATATAWREHWAVGNLKGVYGNATTKMGAAFGDVNGAHLQIDATDGIRMLGGVPAGGVVNGHWDMAGNLSLGTATAGRLTYLATDGSLRITWNGASRLTLLNDGNLYLSTGLIAGAFAGEVATVRSASATDWNAGAGFFFRYTQATGVTTALIGNSVGRRLQWDGLNLLIVSDGFTLDANGIVLTSSSGGISPASSIRWTPGGTTLWDCVLAGDERFEIIRGGPGKIRIEATTTGGGGIELQAGGSGVDRVALTLKSASSAAGTMMLTWASSGGVAAWPPAFVPQTTDLAMLGTASLRWQSVYGQMFRGLYGMFGPGENFAYYLWVNGNQAGKLVSSTWLVPADRATLHTIAPVDPAAALAVVRQVPVVRARTTDGDLPSIGVVGQDVASLLPLSVRARATDGLLDFDAHELFMLNVAAVQALAARVDTLERREGPTV